jgi:3-hydroxyacyl-[acyl-carrier-protein] dehydratase
MNGTHCLLKLKRIELNKSDILTLLPHRENAFILDSAVYDPTVSRDSIVVTKLCAHDDHCFKGHYPDNPIFPGHWQNEAVCLAAALLTKMMFPGMQGFPLVEEIGRTVYKRKITPGDTIQIHANFVKQEGLGKRSTFIFDGKITRGEKIISYLENIIGRPI